MLVSKEPLPILYSFRRCPYAIRARMALHYAGVALEHREITLRSKPQSMLLASPKGTVPVLCIGELVLEQSIDIMDWALGQSDPAGWKMVDPALAQGWIDTNDGPFKMLLDQYKYPNRYPDLNPEKVLTAVKELMLEPMEANLQSSQYLLGGKRTWVDVAIFPFIRQFAMVNPDKFAELLFPALKNWVTEFSESELFHAVMHKYPTWID